MDGIHLSQLLDEAALRRPDHSAVEDEHGRSPDLCRAVAQRGSTGDAADAMGRWSRRPGGSLVAQEP